MLPKLVAVLPGKKTVWTLPKTELRGDYSRGLFQRANVSCEIEFGPRRERR
jgi:hypothetical protein